MSSSFRCFCEESYVRKDSFSGSAIDHEDLDVYYNKVDALIAENRFAGGEGPISALVPRIHRALSEAMKFKIYQCTKCLRVYVEGSDGRMSVLKFEDDADKKLFFR